MLQGGSAEESTPPELRTWSSGRVLAFLAQSQVKGRVKERAVPTPANEILQMKSLDFSGYLSRCNVFKKHARVVSPPFSNAIRHR